jgi:hypothetical protein
VNGVTNRAVVWCLPRFVILDLSRLTQPTGAQGPCKEGEAG